MQPLGHDRFKLASFSVQLGWHTEGLTFPKLEALFARRLAPTLPVIRHLSPPEVAGDTMQCATENRVLTVELAAHRAGWRWLARSPEEPVMPITALAQQAAQLLAELAGQCRARVGRIGIAVERLAAHPSPVLALGYHLLAPALAGELTQPSGMALEVSERIGVAGRAASAVTRIGSVLRRTAAGDSAILLAQELSSLEEEQGAAQLSAIHLSEFAIAAAAQVERALIALFPLHGERA